MPTPTTPPPVSPDPAGALILTGLAGRASYPAWDLLPEAAGLFDDSYDDSFE